MEHRHTPVKVAGTSPFRKPQQSRSVANTAVASPRSSPLSCISCSEKHLLKCSVAPEFEPPASSSTVRSVESSVSAHPATEVSLPAHARSSSTAFLCTVVLTVLDEDGNEHSARALIDSGSQSNFISKRLASRLSLKPERAHILITGVGELATRVSQLVYATIRSRDEYYTSELEFLVLPTLMTELPGRDVDISDWYIPKTVELADPNFNINSPIDMILGADQFHEYLRNGRIHLNRGSPTLIETIFGWAVSGRWYSNFPRIPLRCCTATTTHNLESLMEKFWEIEFINTGRIYSADEVACDELYQATTIRNADGRYVVALPKSQNPHIHLGESRAIAERRLRSLERRLERDEAVKVAYHEFMDEYLRLGHMRRLEDPVDDSLMHYYLPHHPVFKSSSTTTKVRVVFDASCRTSSGNSLNDILLVGPVVQEDLQSIELRFRTKPVGVVSDVEKISKPTDPISTFELQTVTYGTSSAPFLATRTLVQLANDEGENFPMAKKAVLEVFYVDDLISGAETPEEAIELRRQLSEMLSSAGFPLRKWASNSSAVLAEIPSDQLAIQPFYEFSDEQSVTILGLIWEPKTDTLRFRIQLPIPATVFTRRNVLSYIAQIYDPLGLAGPVARATNIQLHFFSDASEKAYGACVYMRSEDQHQNNFVHLLAAKSRVTPLKTRHSIARLELSTAVLSTELFQKVIASLKSDCPVFFWVDSTTVLQWLNSSPACWKVFVGNRVSKIQQATVGHPWNHVAGSDNPADDISRGLTPADLLHCERWWTGPTWLKLPSDLWPNQSNGGDNTSTEERKICLAANATQSNEFSEFLFGRLSSYSKLRRIVAYVFRYLRALCASAARNHPNGTCAVSSKSVVQLAAFLTTLELREAEIALCRLAQRDTFSGEVAALRNGILVNKSSPMKWLNPSISINDVIRVGGRLENSKASDDTKHPIIISGKHPLATLLANHCYRSLLHAGPQLMSAPFARNSGFLAVGISFVRCTTNVTPASDESQSLCNKQPPIYQPHE
ncbi:uncharacterized protein LOC135708281 [Ochlerotatus camptorhynchus]|uniref:uncharacterized protein LOC135708281 n=1 Tax=Ochlerotatus camptorhynchus TaxID=644619 RepID=UPI0031DEA2AA